MTTKEAIRELLNDADKFSATAEGIGFDLRLDLASIIVKHLHARNMSQIDLAKAAGLNPVYLTRVIHSSTNCTFSTAGKILHALGTRASLTETSPIAATNRKNYVEEKQITWDHFPTVAYESIVR